MKSTIVPLLLLCSCFRLDAQQAMNNRGNLQIHAGATLAGFGNFTNTSTGALVNNGTLYVKGTLTNDQASMSAGSGTLHLNGNSAQAVSGSQSFKTNNLNTNNSAGITLNNNLSIAGIHTYTAGIITTSATPNYLVYEAGSSYSGDNDSRHVNGWVKKFGSTNFIFPVGNGTVERTVALNSLSSNSEFNVKYFASTPNAYQLQSPLSSVDVSEYWSIQKASGGSASVAMNWNYSKVYFPNYIIADIRVAGYNGSLWTNNGGTASGSAATTGTITSNSISSFNLFTFGSVTYVLPLSVLNFGATRINDHTAISWTTQSENRADHFEVERSDDGVIFYKITNVTARNSGLTEKYIANDYAAINRIAYYRLKAVDKDGKSVLSRIAIVTVGDDNNILTLLINPVHDQILLMAGSQVNGMYNYSIHSMNGQLVQEGKLNIQGSRQYTIPLTRVYDKGAYSLEVTNGLERFRYKLMIQ